MFKRFLKLVLNTIAVIVVVVVVIVFWGARPVVEDKDVSVKVTVSEGHIQLVHGEEVSDVDLSGEILKGGVARIPSGGVALLSFTDGSSARVDGPAELEVRQSHSFLSKPPPLRQLLARIGLSGGPDEVQIRKNVDVALASGTVLVQVAPAASAESSFRIASPGATVIGHDAVYRITQTSTTSNVQAGRGGPALGMLASIEGKPALVVVPEIPDQHEIEVLTYTGPDAGALMDSLERALATIQPYQGPAVVDSIEFTPVSEDVSYFLGQPSADGTGPASVEKPTIASSADAQQYILSTEAVVQLITDQDVLERLPAGWSAHILPGNAMKVSGNGMTFVLTASVSDGRIKVDGLPLGFDLGQYMTDVPYVLGILTSDGVMEVTYLPDTFVPEPEVEEERPVSVPHVDSYFNSIPSIREISLEPQVIGTNAFFAVLTSLVVAALGALTNALLRREEDTLGLVFRPLSRSIGRIITGIASGLSWLRRIVPLAALEVVLVLLAYGVIYSFLAQDRGIFGPNGLFILVSLTLSVGLVSMAGPYARAIAARFLRVPAKAGVFPANMLIAAGSVAVSRLFSLTPGLILGTPGGLRRDPEGFSNRDRSILAVAGFTGVGVVAGLSWAGAMYAPRLTELPVAWMSGISSSLASALQDILLLTFAAALQGVAFGLLPFFRLPGRAIFQWSKPLWALLFSIVALAVWHVFLNKSDTAPDMVSKNAILFVGAMTGVAALLVLVGLYLRFRRRRSRQAQATSDSPEPGT